MTLKRWLRPLPHLERHPVQHGLLIGFGGMLALGATVGVAWAAAVVLPAGGPPHPGPGFTLPWVIAVPLGTVAAVVALGFRERLHGRGSWRAVLGHAVEALHVLRGLAANPRRYGGAFLGTALY